MTEKRIVDISSLLEIMNKSLEEAVSENDADKARCLTALINVLMVIPVLTKEELHDYVESEYIKSWKP